MTGFGATALNWITGAGGFLGNAAGTANTVGLTWLMLKEFGLKHPTIGAIGENAAGAVKGVVETPIDIVKSFGKGMSAEAAAELGATEAATIGRGLVSTGARGLVMGLVTAAGEWAIDKGMEKAFPVKNEGERQWRDFEKNRGVPGRFRDIWDELSDMAAGRHAGTSVAEHQGLPKMWETAPADRTRRDRPSPAPRRSTRPRSTRKRQGGRGRRKTSGAQCDGDASGRRLGGRCVDRQVAGSGSLLSSLEIAGARHGRQPGTRGRGSSRWLRRP